jgi:hypothetical protein
MAKQNVNATSKTASVETVFVPVRRSTLEYVQVGAAPKPAAVVILENGQIRANTAASTILGGKAAMSLIALLWNPKTRTVRVKTFSEFPAKFAEKYGMSETDFFPVQGKKADAKSENDNVYTGGGPWLREVGYDYAKSGNQTFSLTDSNSEQHWIEFTLPEGALTPKPKQERAKRKNGTGTASTATPANTATPTATDEEDLREESPEADEGEEE